MELLAPAGDYESFIAAVSNGADAIYLGLNCFGARAYAKNFSLDVLKDVVSYAHLRNVKIYVTLNTNIYESELNEVYNTIDELAKLNIDGVIFFDLAVLNYIKNNYPKLEAHASTQTGIDSLYAGLFFKRNKADRLVLARELSISEIKDIKKRTGMEVEVFIHGALCISYSGNCLMSGLIGLRSGNRGRCVGSCRKLYSLYDASNDKFYPKKYLLSTKDLKTLDNIKDLKFIDSLKIEGRMKDPSYVANIVNCYKQAISNENANIEKLNKTLLKTFQRTYTKGYILFEKPNDIVNIERPNNFGFYIGKIIGKNNNWAKIKLEETLNQNDQIRIDSSNEIIFPIVKLYDENKNLINSSSKICYLQIKENFKINDKIYKIRDDRFQSELKTSYPKEYKRLPVNFYVNLNNNQKLEVTLNFENIYLTEYSSSILIESINNSLTDEKIKNGLGKLGDTPYFLNDIQINNSSSVNLYLPLKEINDLRRVLIEKLNQERLNFSLIKTEIKNNKNINFPIQKEIKLACFASTKEQLEAIQEENIEIIYKKDNFIPRNQAKYEEKENSDYLLVGGYGGIEYYYKNKEIISDYSLNVTNSKAIYNLHNNGVNRVTISHELNKTQINQMIDSYYNDNLGYPNLEMIVYGYAFLMHTKYCPLKNFGLCGKCKNNLYYLKDDYAMFPIISNDDCSTFILNSKRLNLIDDLEDIKNINVFRLQFTIESKEETKRIIKIFKEKLKNKMKKSNYFDSSSDTRGHFNKTIL